MYDTDKVFSGYVEVTAELLRLPLEEGWRRAAASNLQTIFELAALIDGFELPDGSEPAPVFEA